MTLDAGSFRDRDSRVFYSHERVFRGLSESAALIDRKVRDTGLMDRLVSSGLLIENWRNTEVTSPAGVPSTAVIESRKLSAITYPEEWSFHMLRDAALATLDTNLSAMEAGFILKDASAFNVAFVGADPLILDVSSLSPVEDHMVWTAYGQFVDHFLSPLMLEAYTGMSFQTVLRNSLVGFPVISLDLLLRGRRRYRSGVTTHVRLRSRVERRARDMETDVVSGVAGLSLPPSAIESSIRKMRDLVASLETPNVGLWEGYESALPYEESQTESKLAFVRRAVGRIHEPESALDVGANEGLFTRILADRFDTVIAIDNDPGVVDALYGALDGEERRRVTPLVVDILNPTPAFGLRGRERPTFSDRIKPSFSTWLAVIHHLCIGQGVPLSEIVDLVTETSAESVVEFVGPDDPMVKRISASRPESLDGYNREEFEALVSRRLRIADKESVSRTRTIYHLERIAG